MKRRLLLSLVACSLVLGVSSLQAKSTKRELVQNEINHQAKQHKVAPKEIILGMQKTFQAFGYLHQDKVDKAKKLLKEAKEEFDKALKNNPKLDLIPIDMRFQAFEFLGDAKTIQKNIDTGIKLLKSHDTQAAIGVIAPLKDELDISTVFIPMKIYPVAESKALDLLNKGKKKEAMIAIAEAMNSLVIVREIIPTPLLVAQDLIVSASKLDKNKKDEAEKLLEGAKEELKRAELLGYTKLHPQAYKDLTKSIEAIQKEIKGKNVVEKLYDKLKGDFKSLLNKTRKDTIKDSVAQKEAKALTNPASVKGIDKARLELEKIHKEELKKAKEKSAEFKKEAKKDEKK